MIRLLLETTSGMKMRPAFPGLLGPHGEPVLTLSELCFPSTPELHTWRAIGIHGKAKLINSIDIWESYRLLHECRSGPK